MHFSTVRAQSDGLGGLRQRFHAVHRQEHAAVLFFARLLRSCRARKVAPSAAHGSRCGFVREFANTVAGPAQNGCRFITGK